MCKIINALVDLFLIGFCVYVGVFKANPTMRDLAFMIAVTCINVYLNQDKLSRLLKE